MVLAFLMFLAMYVIAGTMIRLYTMKFPDNGLSRALQFAH
jgi:hypothetical protein